MFTNFDKAWFGPAFGNWLASGAIMFAEKFFGTTLPGDAKTFITMAIVGVVVYFVPNKPAPAPVAAPTADSLRAEIKAGIEAPKAS